MSQTVNDIDQKALEALMARVSEAKEHDLALSADDCQLLLDALVTLSTMQERLANHDVTVHKLRKLLGIDISSEALARLTKNKQGKGGKNNRKPKNKDQDFTPAKPKVTVHTNTQLKKGDDCPECKTGKVYKVDPGSLLRITGQTPFVPEQHVTERLRCNTCGAYFTADLPDEVLKDGDEQQKYGYSARSLMAIHKYFAGLPFYRQGSIQKLLGVKITASTVFDQVEYVANDIYPVYQTLVSLAADAKHYHIDDTTHRILGAKPVEKTRRNSDKIQLRSGVYTSGMIASTKDNCAIVLFETNIGHAGEFIDSVLHRRGRHQQAPIIMSDALASNRPTAIECLLSLCNSHARRQFVDVIHQFPDEVEHVLTQYGKIWHHEQQAIEQQLSPAARLSYHQQYSEPIMTEIKRWCEGHLADDSVEENSSLGKAMCYFIKHFDGLTMFCQIEGAQLDNNRMEALLKIVVRDRKNAMFHKTLLGATIGDIITSMIATASEAGINVFSYFTYLQRESEKVKANPEAYLPWNYQEQ